MPRRLVGREGLALAVGVTLAMVVTACSSGSGGSTGPASSSAASAGVSDGLAAAKAFVAAHSSPPTQIPAGLTSLPSKPPTGKTIALVSAPVSDVTVIAAALKQATAALGWTLKVYNTTGTPESTASAMNLAVQSKPDAVIQLGFPKATFPDAVASLQKAGIPYIEGGTTDSPGPDLKAVVSSGEGEFAKRGVWSSHWIAADSNGKADVAIFSLSNYPVLVDFSNALKTTMQSDCGGSCRVDVQDAQLSNAGSVPSQVVSYLQSHPSVNYLVFTAAALTVGLPQALAAANLSSRVKIVDSGDDLTQLEAGQQAVIIPDADIYLGWVIADAAVRAIMHLPMDETNYSTDPAYYITSANLPAKSTLTDGFISDYMNSAPQFKKIWMLG